MKIEAKRTEFISVEVQSWAEFRAAFEDYEAFIIDEREVMGVCEGCNEPILEALAAEDDEEKELIPADTYACDEEGGYWHKRCVPDDAMPGVFEDVE